MTNLPDRIEQASEGSRELDAMKADTIKGPTILLQSGRYFSYERPDLCEMSLEDIARGLANTCRFAGQSPRFYSVAEHSVYVSQIVPDAMAWDGLMHDAAEAFICDMPKPLKVMLPDYKEVEKRVEKAVASAFGLNDPMPPEIKYADVQMLRAEQMQVMRNNDAWEWTFNYPCPEVTIACLSPDAAFDLFMTRAAALRAHGDEEG